MKKKICILDYGSGNIRSLKNSLKKIGYNSDFFSDNYKRNYDLVFIPGVGSFSKSSKLIKKTSSLRFLKKARKESLIFGICLGMQLFMTSGEEAGKSKGLNFIEGNVKKFKKSVILPVVGKRKVLFKKNLDLKFLKKFSGEKFYFTHSYYVNPKNEQHYIGYSKYENMMYCTVIKNMNLFGTQFHPEKSGELGLNFLESFIKNA